jgi:hypothetical protein
MHKFLEAQKFLGSILLILLGACVIGTPVIFVASLLPDWLKLVTYLLSLWVAATVVTMQ